MMNNQRKAYVYGITTVLFWSTVATAFKLALAQLDVLQLILYASITSAAVLLLAVSWQGRVQALWPTFRAHWRISLFAAALNPFVYYMILFAAYDRLPAQVAQPINYTWAIVLTLLSMVILKQRMTTRDLLAAVICYGGVVIIAGQGEWRPGSIAQPLGIMLALGSTVIWAVYWIVNMRDQREPLLALCLNFLCAIPMALAACLAFSDPRVTVGVGLGAAVYIGIFEMGLAFLCWSQALRLAENTSRVSNLIFLAPFLSLLLIHYVLGEPIYTSTFIGLGVIVGGLLLQKSALN